MTTISNVGSVLGALGPMAGGFGFAGANAPQDFPNNTGAPFYPNTGPMGTVGANFYGGGMGGMGGMGGIGSFANMYGTTAGTNTYGMNMPIM